MNLVYKVLIVDDEPFAHNLLEQYCQRIDTVEVVGNAFDGVEALQFIQNNLVDIILLDIHLPQLSGMELLKVLVDKNCKVIMVTANSNFAIDTYNYSFVVDYLLKPIKFIRFLQAIEKVHNILKLEDLPNGNKERLDINSSIIYITEGKTIHRIESHTLFYAQSYGNYVKLYGKDRMINIIRITLTKLIEELPKEFFCRVHKSYLVNLSIVSKLALNKVYLQNEKELPLGTSYSKYVKERFTQSSIN
jgi:DNA-binding LytR/AlgR family response regulator